MKHKKPIAFLSCISMALMSTALVSTPIADADDLQVGLVPDSTLAECIANAEYKWTNTLPDWQMYGITASDFTALEDATGFVGLDCNGVGNLKGIDNLRFNATSVSSSPTGSYLTLSIVGAPDLSFVGDVPGLDNLILSGPQVSNILGLAGLTSLRLLNLSDCDISDLSALENMTQLQTLDLSSNSISDISILSNLKNLQTLNLQLNPLQSIASLTGLTDLTNLDLFSTGISDISSLAGLTNLESLSLWTNDISDIGPLENLTNLTYLLLGDNPFSDISALENLTNLVTLRLGGSSVTDLTPLEGLSSLQDLNLNGCKIEDVTPLAGLTGLQYLDISQNMISDISSLTYVPTLSSFLAYGQELTGTANTGSPASLPSVTGLSGEQIDWNPTSGSVSCMTINAAGTSIIYTAGYQQCFLLFDDNNGFSGRVAMTLSGSSGNSSSMVVATDNPESTSATSNGSGNTYQVPNGNSGTNSTVSGSNSTATQNQSQSSVTGGAARVANGEDAYQLRVSLRNSSGQPLVGMASHITLTSVPSGVTIAGVVDNGDGTYTVSATSDTPGIYQVRVQCDGVTIVGTITVNFIDGTVGEVVISPGATQVLTGYGFMPGEQVTVVVHSAPVLVATLTADANGLVKAAWSVPSGFMIGAHIATWTGSRSGSVSTNFTVGRHTSAATGGTVTNTLPSSLAVVISLVTALALILLARRHHFLAS